MNAQPDPDNVGDYLISARSFTEYRAMFALTEDDLCGDILDCPGGASGFTAEAANLTGVRPLAVDPTYAMPHGELAALAVAENDRGNAHTIAGTHRYVWDFYGDATGHHRIRQVSAELFGADLIANPERYVAAALPSLPFADGQFDLVLSSHFLFTYADRLDRDFHLRSLIELHRVASGDVRVFPLLDQAGGTLEPLVEELRTGLAAAAIRTEIRAVDYEFQRGGNEMLVLH